jgi:hypothetical protein
VKPVWVRVLRRQLSDWRYLAAAVPGLIQVFLCLEPSATAVREIRSCAGPVRPLREPTTTWRSGSP